MTFEEFVVTHGKQEHRQHFIDVEPSLYEIDQPATGIAEKGVAAMDNPIAFHDGHDGRWVESRITAGVQSHVNGEHEAQNVKSLHFRSWDRESGVEREDMELAWLTYA